MRAAFTVAPFLLASAPAFALAQTAPYAAQVVDPEVKLRAGSSDKYPESGTLPRGAWVVVDHEEAGGWLAVKPPVGSVSWVPAQFVKGFDPGRPLPQNVAVQGEGEVTLAAGQVGIPQPLEIRKVKVPDGTILAVVGGKVTFQNKVWYPVMPPDGDFRYLPKTAVRAGPATNDAYAVTGTSTAKPNPPPTAAVPPTPAPAEPAAAVPAAVGAFPRSGGSDPLWSQAERAEAAGRLDEAERLFFELARKMNEPGGDHDVANQCYTRIHGIREKKRLGAAAGATSSTASTPAEPRTDDRTVSTRPEDRVGSRTAGTAATDRSTLLPPAADPRDADDLARPKWTGAGFLIRTAYSLDGKTTYALETTPRAVRFYVVEGPGIDLRKSVNKQVNLFGTVSARRDVSQPVMVVTAVDLEP